MISRPCLRLGRLSALVLGVSLLLPGGWSGAAEGPGMPAVDARVRASLGRPLQTLEQARSLTADLKLLIRVEMQGMKQEMPADYSLAVQRPNRFALLLREGIAGATVVSDGTNLYTHVPLLKKYTQTPAPTNFTGLSAAEAGPGMQAGPGTSFISDLFSEAPERKLLQGVTNAVHAGQDTVDGVACEHLQFFQEELNWDLWIEAGASPWIRRMTADLGRFMQKLPEINPDAGPMADMLRQMKMTLQLDFRNWKLNPALAADRFAFVPPAGSSKVEDWKNGLGQSEEEGPEERHPLVGQPAPALQLELLDGGRVDLASLQGRQLVLLDFWATWCGPCVKALPVLAEVAAAFKDRGVAFYAVNFQEEPDIIRKFLAKQKLRMPVALDRDGKAGERFGVEGIPQTVVVGKDGVVQVVHVGFLPDLKERLTRELEDLLAGRKPGVTAPAGKSP